jgi:hypothetical protein
MASLAFKSFSSIESGFNDEVTVLIIVTVEPPVVVVTVVVFPCIVVSVVVVFSIVVFVVVVGVVVVVSVVVFADVASASVPPLTASIKLTTGGVTTENRPHFSKKARLSALCLASSFTLSVMIAPTVRQPGDIATILPFFLVWHMRHSLHGAGRVIPGPTSPKRGPAPASPRYLRSGRPIVGGGASCRLTVSSNGRLSRARKPSSRMPLP